MSRRSIAAHSFVRNPVSAANTTSGPYTGPSSILSASISAGVNGSSSSLRGSGLRPALDRRVAAHIFAVPARAGHALAGPR